MPWVIAESYLYIRIKVLGNRQYLNNWYLHSFRQFVLVPTGMEMSFHGLARDAYSDAIVSESSMWQCHLCRTRNTSDGPVVKENILYRAVYFPRSVDRITVCHMILKLPNEVENPILS